MMHEIMALSCRGDDSDDNPKSSLEDPKSSLEASNF
jgi:hypothetical protein